MASGISTPDTTIGREPFWERQFGEEITRAQIVFDVLFGIVLPVVCFVADPGIIRSGGTTGLIRTNLASYRLFIYTLSAVTIPALAVWLTFGERYRQVAGAFAGGLFAAMLCSLAIGVDIIPLSVLGLVIVIGILGFVPFVTAFVYLRNAIRGWRRARAVSPAKRLATASLALLLVVGLSAGAQVGVTQMTSEALQQAISGDPQASEAALGRLHRLRWFADSEAVMSAYLRETDQARKEQLARAYQAITGEDIESVRVMRAD